MVDMTFSPVRHKIDVYVQEVVVSVLNTIVNPAVVSFNLPLGVIRNVKVVFPRGCNRHISLCIDQHSAQWLPADAGSVFEEDPSGIPLDFNVYHDVWNDQQDFEIIAWNDAIDVYWDHTITVYFTMELSEVL
jgi:hypothetical protein